MIETLGWYKDQWLDIDRIFIAANNRGLKFADGIFETILIKENKPILFDEHLKRLEKSSKILNINLKINKLTLRQLIHDGIQKLSLKNDQFASVRINYSRGTNEGRTHLQLIALQRQKIWIIYGLSSIESNQILIQ